MAVTQKFIANEAGVSQKTVSLYFQNSPLVSDHTREKLREVTEQYGYLPNQAARSIKTKRFKRIACVVIQYVTDRKRDLQLRHPHLLAYINGAALELAKYGYSLVLEPLLLDHLTQEYITSPDLFKSLSVDGIIGLPGGWVPEFIDTSINSMGLPVVWLNRNPVNGKDFSCINIDDAAGARQLTSYLLDKGYRKIAWFGPEIVQDVTFHYSAKERFNAVQQTLNSRGQKLYKSVFSRRGRNLSEAVFELFKDETPDAVICSHFQYQEATVYAAMSYGLMIPHDVEVVHFASSWEYNPDIYNFKTFILLPEMQIGQTGARYLYRRLCGESDNTLLRPLAGTLHIGTPLTFK